ncbi:MAG: hypothetical protein KC444_08960 [Nitrosopumilus sp.]|nr:hypothetical protein [Nitrosopumilus sp.]
MNCKIMTFAIILETPVPDKNKVKITDEPKTRISIKSIEEPKTTYFCISTCYDDF